MKEFIALEDNKYFYRACLFFGAIGNCFFIVAALGKVEQTEKVALYVIAAIFLGYFLRKMGRGKKQYFKIEDDEIFTGNFCIPKADIVTVQMATTKEIGNKAFSREAIVLKTKKSSSHYFIGDEKEYERSKELYGKNQILIDFEWKADLSKYLPIIEKWKQAQTKNASNEKKLK